jgi:4'-phosphopantetheinyl transferase EntD
VNLNGTLSANAAVSVAPPPQESTGEINNVIDSLVAQTLTAAAQPLGVSGDVAFAALLANQAPDTPDARMLAPRASTKRKVEFTCGRAAARLALAGIGVHEPGVILRGSRGEPLWPAAVTGSITHCHPWSIAVAAKSSSVMIGIDLESIHRMQGPDISHMICRPTELAWIHEGAERAWRLTMIFSAKEAVYKLLNPVCGRYVDFQEVELSWFPPGYFQAQLLTDCGSRFPAGRLIKVQCQKSDNLVFSCAIHALGATAKNYS